MAYAIPNTFAGLSGNQAASLLDSDFTTCINAINNVFLVGTLAARPAPDGVGNGRYYFATDTNGGTLYRDNGSAWVQVAPGVSTTTTWTDQLTGLTLSNDGVTPNTVLDIAVGGAASDDAVLTNRIFMSLTSAYTKTTGAWAVGTGNGGLDTGAIGNSSTYHVFLIQRTDTNVVDVLFSLSATAPTMPANYTKKRRIGSFRTTGAAAIIAFVQDGDYFRLLASVLDVNTTNPGTAAVTATLTSVPTGVKMKAVVNLHFISTTVASFLQISDLAANDEAPSATAAPLGVDYTDGTVVSQNRRIEEWTNTSAQIRYRASASDGNTIVRIATLGWIDRRGR